MSSEGSAPPDEAAGRGDAPDVFLTPSSVHAESDRLEQIWDQVQEASELPPRDGLLDEITAFLSRATASGSVLGFPSDRHAVAAVVQSWARELARHDVRGPSGAKARSGWLLAEFDPNHPKTDDALRRAREELHEQGIRDSAARWMQLTMDHRSGRMANVPDGAGYFLLGRRDLARLDPALAAALPPEFLQASFAARDRRLRRRNALIAALAFSVLGGLTVTALFFSQQADLAEQVKEKDRVTRLAQSLEKLIALASDSSELGKRELAEDLCNSFAGSDVATCLSVAQEGWNTPSRFDYSNVMAFSEDALREIRARSVPIAWSPGEPCVGWAETGGIGARAPEDTFLAGPDRSLLATRDLVIRSMPPSRAGVPGRPVGKVPAGSGLYRAARLSGRYAGPDVAEAWEAVIPVNPRNCVTVYIQYAWDETGAAVLGRTLAEKGYTVPGPERLATAEGLLEIRHAPARGAEAAALADELSGEGLLPARPRLVTLPALAFSDDAPLELWIDPDAAQEPEGSGP